MSIRATARGTIQSCQIESGAQLKTPRLLLLRDGDCGEERILGQRRIRRMALEQNPAAQAMQESVAPVFSCLTCKQPEFRAGHGIRTGMHPAVVHRYQMSELAEKRHPRRSNPANWRHNAMAYKFTANDRAELVQNYHTAHIALSHIKPCPSRHERMCWSKTHRPSRVGMCTDKHALARFAVV
jgi:hypothetical protein